MISHTRAIPVSSALRIALRTAGVSCVLSVAVMVIGCSRKGPAQGQMPALPPPQVTAVTAIVRDVPVYLDEIGTIVPMEVVSIVPQVGGKIVAVNVEDGADVTKGELLFEIDPRPYEAALAAAEATLAQNRADLALARSELGRMEDTIESAVSRMEIDRRRNAVTVGEAKVAASEAAVTMAKLDVEYTKIRSPITGRAGARLIHRGNVVRENGEPLLTIQQLDPIYAEFTVTENDLNTVRRFMAARASDRGGVAAGGLKVEVSVPSDAPVRATDSAPVSQRADPPPCPCEGVVTFLDNAVQTGTGTVKLRATVPNASRYFWPGQFVNVRLILTIQKDAVLVPAEAQQIGQQGPYVYVIDSDDTAELRLIRPGQRQANLIVVEQGVKPGERVVVTGHRAVRPAGKVTVVHGDPGMASANAAR